MSIQNSVDDLSASAHKNAAERGVLLCSQLEKAAELQLLWTRHLLEHSKGVPADCLLAGCESAIREAAACLILGLVRPALNSLRVQIDLAMSWLYFKDHPIEWNRIQETGENFKLKKELTAYLRDWHPAFASRWGILIAIKERSVPDPYRLLSAHVHGQNALTLPTISVPADVIGTHAHQDDVVALQFECSEFITDLYWSVFADNWRSLPSSVMDTLSKRFVSSAQRTEFFGP